MEIFPCPSRRLIGSMVIRLVTYTPCATSPAGWLAPFQQVSYESQNGVGGRRAPRQPVIHFDELAQWSGLLAQHGHAVVRREFVRLGSVHIQTPQQLAHGNVVAHGGHVSGDGAVPE